MNKDFERPSADLIRDLYQVSSATATGTLSGLGIRDAYLQGPIARTPGTKVVGPAITLQFLPKREDQTTGLGAGQTEQRSALWAVLEHVQPGDVMVVDARGQMRTGCFGEMLLTYFQGAGREGCHRGRLHPGLPAGAGFRDAAAPVDTRVYAQLGRAGEHVAVGLQRARRLRGSAGDPR